MWKKVVAPTALVSLFWVVVSCGTSYVLNQLDETQTSLLNQNRSVIQAAGGMQENLWRLQATLLEAAELLEKRSGARVRFRADAERIEAAFDGALARASENSSTADEKALIVSIGEAFAKYQAFSREQLARTGLSPEEAASSVDAAMRLARAVAKPCDDLSEVAQRLTSEAFQRLDRLRGRVEAARISFIIIGPAVGILLGLWVARGLHHTISEISVTLRGASGDLDQQIGLVEVHPTDELNGLPALQQQVQAVSGRIKQVVTELQRTRREAVRAERLAAVGELATGVAHELRNPLTSVKLLIQAVQRNQAAATPDAERLRVVEQEVARMETTIRELLDFARPPKLRRVRHNVRDTLRRALTLVASRAQQGHVVIEEELGCVPAPVDADPEQLDQVFVNLLLNAIEAMTGGGILHVAIDRGANSSDGLLRIVFRDTGTGISDEVMSRLFEPFVTSKERGIGLGLAISRRIMQEHGGSLTASNPPPGGAMFVVEVPLAEAGEQGGLTGSDSPTSHRASETFFEQTVEAARH
ncbi:MAG TPA: ATP-binding protein [Pirellulales bacterium]|nr:ATP-binding protein [Pirellulales bacterium]